MFTSKSIKCGEPKLREILENHSNMTDQEKNILKTAIIKNLYIPKIEKR